MFPYSQYQKNLLSIIDSLRDNGFSYRRITKYFNSNNIKTPRGNTWGVTGNSVYSMIKKRRLREERIKGRGKHTITNGKMFLMMP